MNTPHDDFDEFDERAREAGRALRQAPPADGLARVERARRNRRLAQVGGAAAVAVLVAGGVVALVRRGDDGTIVTTDPTTIPTTNPTTTPPTTEPGGTTPPTSNPGAVPPTVPGTTPATPTTLATPVAPTTTPATTVPPSPGAPSVWVGGKLAGWYDGVTFVANEFGAALPDGLLGADVTVVGLDGATHPATVTDEHCSTAHLSPSPDDWSLLATADAPVAGIAFEAAANPADVDAALVAAGADPAASRSVAVPVGGDGAALRLVLADGWSDTFQFPTWITVWDGSTLTTIEGDPDPSNALDIGNPIEAFYDLDGDGAWEIVFAVGDGWGVVEVSTGESIAFGDGHPCPEVFAEPGVTPSALAGEWSLDPNGESAALIADDGIDTVLWYGFCQAAIVGVDGLFTVESSGDCLGDEADPRLAGLSGASMSSDGGDTVVVQPFDGATYAPFALYRIGARPGLDLERGTVAGVRAGEVGVADELIGRITAELGQPDLDTGWFTTPANPNPDSPDCLAGMNTRALWWGDLAVSLWPRDGSGRVDYAELWDWTLGAQPGVVNLPEGTSYTPAVSGLVTNEGVALGISQDAASALFSGGLDWTDGDPSAGGQFAYLQGRPPHYSGNYVGLFSDGQAITQISATRTFC